MEFQDSAQAKTISKPGPSLRIGDAWCAAASDGIEVKVESAGDKTSQGRRQRIAVVKTQEDKVIPPPPIVRITMLEQQAQNGRIVVADTGVAEIQRTKGCVRLRQTRAAQDCRQRVDPVLAIGVSRGSTCCNSGPMSERIPVCSGGSDSS